jgi:hypothetical protein
MIRDLTCWASFHRKPVIVPLMFCSMAFVVSPATAQIKDDRSQITNDKGCTQQERSNETVGEKLVLGIIAE